MKISDYIRHDGLGLAELIKKRDVNAVEVCEAALTLHSLTDPKISAIVETWPDDVQGELARSPSDAPFRGVPFLIKDLSLNKQGKKLESGSRLGQGYTAKGDSALTCRFRNAGLLTIGRTKSPEFGFSPTTETLLYGSAKNPWDESFSAGGSSGGAAGAVGARVVPIAHASDGGGSIRIPAAHCGLVGIKPTRGRISAAPAAGEGLLGLSAQFAVSRTVRDSAALLDIVAGAETGDPYAIAPPEAHYLSECKRDPKRLRIGVLTHPLSGKRSAPVVAQAAEKAAALCVSLGHLVEEATPSLGMNWDGFIELNAVIWCTTLVSWTDAIAAATRRTPDESTLQPETLAAYRYGSERSAADVHRALAARNIATRSFASFFERYDILLSPTMVDLPLPLGSFATGWGTTGLDWTDFIFDRAPFTPIFNVSGLPAMSVPLVHDEPSGLPIGIQLGAALGREDLLFRLAGQLERVSPWIDRVPMWLTEAAA